MVRRAEPDVFQQQAVIRNSDPITQNQWYDAWDGSAVAAGAGSVKKNVRLKSLSLDQATANEDIEIRIIADELDETLTQTAVADTNYFLAVEQDPDGLVALELVTTQQNPAFVLEARNLQIMYRKTTAAGGNDTNLKVIHSLIPQGGDRLEDSAKVAIARLVCGTAILLGSGYLHVNSFYQAISLFLLGVPVEYIQTLKKMETKT